jgi:hypothetical protein
MGRPNRGTTDHQKGRARLAQRAFTRDIRSDGQLFVRDSTTSPRFLYAGQSGSEGLGRLQRPASREVSRHYHARRVGAYGPARRGIIFTML